MKRWDQTPVVELVMLFIGVGLLALGRRLWPTR